MNDDYLKVARECGAIIYTKKDDDGVYFHRRYEFEDYASRILASQQAAHDAEIAKLKEENAWYKSEGQALERTRITLCDGLSTANERIAYLETLVALQAEALNTCSVIHVSTITGYEEKYFDKTKVDAAISASAETVQAFRDKLTEPLRREVAIGHELVAHVFNDELMDGVFVERMENFINNTQDTAQACEAELRNALASFQNERAEYLCVDCNCIHPVQVAGKIVQLCPKCGAIMMPTSFNLRLIAEYKQREAALQEKLERLQQDFTDHNNAADAAIAQYKQRAEAAEARIKTSQEQEPEGEFARDGGKWVQRDGPMNGMGQKLYKQPPILPELAELQRVNKELKAELVCEVKSRKAAVAQADEFVKSEGAWRWQGDGTDHLESLLCPILIRAEELRKLLEESKVPEEVLIEIVTQAHMAGQFNQSQRDPSYYEARVYYGEKQLEIRAMLAVAPQPPKEQS